MKIQHITICGTTIVRDTADITPETAAYFSPIRLKPDELWPKKTSILNSGIKCRILYCEGFAVFLMQVGQIPITYSVVCFGKCREDCLQLIDSLFAKNYPHKIPDDTEFLYSIVLDAAMFHLEKLQMAGKLEFYIWHTLRKKMKRKRSS